MNSILIADDEYLIRWSLSQELSREGYKTEAVADGMKAMEAMKGKRFDVVITDLSMPGMDGWKLLEQVQKMYPGTKVIVITAYGKEDTEEKVKEKGAYAYVEKPDIVHHISSLLKTLSHDSNGYLPH